MHIYLKRSKDIIGAYGYDDTIMLCQVQSHGGELTIVEAACIKGGINTIGDSLLQDYNFHAHRVNITIQDQHIIKRYLELPYMNHRKTIQYIKYELYRIYAIDINKYKFSYYKLGTQFKNRCHIQRILAIAIPISTMEVYRACFEDIGLKVITFIAPFDAKLAVLRHIDKNIKIWTEVLCLVHIEMDNVEVYFYHEHEILSIASIQYIPDRLDDLAIEFKRIFDYFHIENYDKSIDVIILSGNCHNDKKYVELFNYLGYKCYFVDNQMLGFKSHLDDRIFSPAIYVKALGAALYN